MSHRLVALALAIALFFAPSALARPADRDAAVKAALAEVAAAQSAFDVPGMAIVVVADGKILLAQGLGQRGLEDATAVDADTRFAIGSCSKAFTALGVAMLAEEGRLALTDRVAAYDPLLALSAPGAAERLTVADLLAQRSGFARHDFLWHARPDMTRAAFAAAQASLAMRNTPGGRFGYTNTSVILAGRLVDLRAGQNWEDFTTARIFTPLGMTRSNFSSQGLAADANAARATKRANGASRTVAWRDARLLGPAGAINSTAHDMGRWLLMLTGDGAIDGRALVTPETLRTLWTPVAGSERAPRKPAGENEDAGGYALGWRVDTWRGERRVSHSGAVDGFRARVTVFPEARVGIAVMANLGPTQLPDFATRVFAEEVLGLPRKTDLMAYANARRSVEAAALGKPATLPPGRLARLGAKDTGIAPTATAEAMHGVYEHPAYGDIRIEAADEANALRIVFGALHGRLDPWRGDSFIAISDWPDDTLDEGEFVFASDGAGAVTGFTAMIDKDIAPVRFVRTGPLPPPPAPEAELTALPDAPPPRGPEGAMILIFALGAGVLLSAAGWAYRLHRARRTLEA